MDPKVRLGENIKRLRLEAGLTQEQLGLRMRMNASELSRLERGKNDARLSTLVRVAIALDVPVSDLVKAIPAANR